MIKVPEATRGVTTVVNVKVGHIRPGHDNLQEWCEDPKNVYIGRKGIVFIADENGDKERFPKQDSIWANPFKIPAKGGEEDRKSVITQYEEYIREKLDDGDIPAFELEALRNKNLGCWCVDTPVTYNPDRDSWRCHGQVLLQLLEEHQAS
jgi:hypothetical protein